MTEVGEILPDITQIFEKKFKECVEQNKHRREPYYIFVKGNWCAQNTQFRLTIAPMDFVHPILKSLNTMCWKIDNKSGRIEEMWVLPFDDPDGIFDPGIPLGPVDEGLIKIAKFMPLKYN